MNLDLPILSLKCLLIGFSPALEVM